ncbi:MAG: terminase small subunit, partial [Oscillospiraceae bacterium]|nr:terminase small subunit [Oscillospiraceae bacterium]
MSELSQKERLFCIIYSKTRNGRESAARAGYSVFLEKNAEKLLNNKRIKEEIDRLDRENAATAAEVYAGLRRIAFGSGNDAVRLIYKSQVMDEQEIDSLDIFNISSIKKAKDGGVEIKFFDRQ